MRMIVLPLLLIAVSMQLCPSDAFVRMAEILDGVSESGVYQLLLVSLTVAFTGPEQCIRCQGVVRKQLGEIVERHARISVLLALVVSHAQVEMGHG